jgi:hypothetical protein
VDRDEPGGAGERRDEEGKLVFNGTTVAPIMELLRE